MPSRARHRAPVPAVDLWSRLTVMRATRPVTFGAFLVILYGVGNILDAARRRNRLTMSSRRRKIFRHFEKERLKILDNFRRDW